MEEKETLEYTAPAAESEPAPAPQPSAGTMARTFSRMGFVLCLGMLAAQLLPLALKAIPGFDIQAHAFLVGGLCTGLITLPMMILFTRSAPARQPDRNGLRFKGFLALICISYAAMIAGNLIGMGVNTLLSPKSVDLISNMISTEETSIVEKIVGLAILAPVFEELVFRKVLVDRVLPYGEWPAILFSGLTFGLFHGNLVQLFYAAMLGFILAYVYIRTGNIFYTMGIHAFINFTSVIVSLAPFLSILSFSMLVAGVVLFFVLRKQIHVEKNAVPGVGGAMFGNAGMILFLILSVGMLALVAVGMNRMA